jgi:transposase
MDTDEEPSGLSISSETETGHVGGGATCIVVGLLPFRKPDRKMVVILDNARWHHAKALTPWLTEHQDIFRLDYLPPYSPDLNNIERVWKLTRKLCTHNRYFAMLEDIAETVSHQFDMWSQPNDVLRRLCAIN